MPVSAMYYPDISGERCWVSSGPPTIISSSYPISGVGSNAYTYFTPIVFERPFSFDAIMVAVSGGAANAITSIKGFIYSSDEEGLPGTKIEHTGYDASFLSSENPGYRKIFEVDEYVFPAGVYWNALRFASTGASGDRAVRNSATGINYRNRFLPSSTERVLLNFNDGINFIHHGPYAEDFPDDISLETDYLKLGGGNPFFALKITNSARNVVHTEEVKKV